MNAVVSVVAPVLVPLFFLGLAGSLLVVVFTTFKDLREVFRTDDDPADDLT